jgi:chromosome segregation ATPase
MIDQQLARLRTHRNNIQRYRDLLKTSLTEFERQFVQKRLTEEQSSLEGLTTSLPDDSGRSKAGLNRPGIAGGSNS